MNSHPCRRLWEAEAAHDDRLPPEAVVSFLQHAAQCAECAAERMHLTQLTHRLKAMVKDPDEVSLRRLRQRTLESAGTWTRRQGGERRPRWPWMLVVATCVGVVLVWRGAKPRDASAPSVLVTALGDTNWSRHSAPGHDLIDLNDGELRLVVHRQRDEERLIVRVPDGDIEDQGTVFSVWVRQRRTVRIAVDEGAVVFRRSGRDPVFVEAGGLWAAPDDATGPARRDPARVIDAVRSSGPGAVLVPATGTSGAPTPPRAPRSPVRREATPPPGDIARADEDASYIHIIELLREGRSEPARAAASEYLRRFPKGFRRREVERVTEQR